MQIKIAYLVLCHSNPVYIARLVKKLSSKNSHVFIHVDKKTNIEPFEKNLKSYENYTLLKERIKVFWGGYSSIEATLSLMKCALNKDNFDRFVILQGLDYPIKSNKEIEEFFINNYDVEFIYAQNVSIRNDVRSVHKYRLYHYLDNPNCIRAKIANKIKRYCLKKDFVPHFKSNKIKDREGRKFDIYQGCAQIALTQRAVKYIVDFNSKNKKFNNYFKTTFAVDESYFHTIIYNSEFKTNATGVIIKEFPRLVDFRNLTYFEYPGDTVQITVFKDESDYEKLKDTGYLFFRKATEESYKLLDYIDYVHEKKL